MKLQVIFCVRLFFFVFVIFCSGEKFPNNLILTFFLFIYLSDPIIIDTKMFAVHCSWNHNGTLLAIAGRQYLDEKEINLVQFYNPFGEHLRTLKVPGNSISCCVWEGGSLRVALAVDSFVYFANIRPDYKWCYFKKTVVFTSCRPQKTGISVSFWDTSNNQVKNILLMRSL